MGHSLHLRGSGGGGLDTLLMSMVSIRVVEDSMVKKTWVFNNQTILPAEV
jgi:hypothetical protein